LRFELSSMPAAMTSQQDACGSYRYSAFTFSHGFGSLFAVAQMIFAAVIPIRDSGLSLLPMCT